MAVLWFDLMFDVQILRSAASQQGHVDSIAAYYRRVTTEAMPMGYLVGAVMLLTVGAAVHRAMHEHWRTITIVALVLCAAPIILALLRTVPEAQRLGSGDGTLDERVAMARRICRDHLACFAAMLGFVVLQIAGGQYGRPPLLPPGP